MEEGLLLFTRLLSSCCGEAGLGWVLHSCDVQQATFSFQRVGRSLLCGLSRMCVFPAEPWTGDVKKNHRFCLKLWKRELGAEQESGLYLLCVNSGPYQTV